MISARVAPLVRSIIARIFAPLLSARGVVALAGSRLADFFSALTSFFGVALAFPPLAAFWPLGARFLWLACFFGETFSGATCAPCSAPVAAVLVSALVMLFPRVLFCAWLAHDDSSLRSA